MCSQLHCAPTSLSSDEYCSNVLSDTATRVLVAVCGLYVRAFRMTVSSTFCGCVTTKHGKPAVVLRYSTSASNYYPYIQNIVGVEFGV